jgi:uncharacterized protein
MIGYCADDRNALTFAETLSGIDKNRTGIWGISYSGGHVLITAALDSRSAFAISTIPVVDGFQTMRRVHGEVRFAQLNSLLAEDRRNRFRRKPSGQMPMSPEKDVTSNQELLPGRSRMYMPGSRLSKRKRHHVTSTGTRVGRIALAV